MRRLTKKAAGPSILIAVMLLAVAVIAEAQQPKKVYRIAYLSHRHGIGPDEEAFRQRLQELGYIEGKNLVIEWRFTSGRLDRHPEVAAELVRLKVDCIVTIGVAPTRAAKQASSTIPLVMGNASDDPVRHGLIASLARPGGNVTGLIDIAQDLAGKRLEILKETVPKATRMAIVWSHESPVATTQVKETEMAAPALGVRLQPLELHGPEDLENVFRTANKGKAGALIVVSFGFVINHQERIVNLAITDRLPVMYIVPEFVHAGGLMSYAPDIADQLRRAAVYVDKILKGTKPADLPVEQPKKFEFIINLKAAKQIGLTIPPNVLARADRVIK